MTISSIINNIPSLINFNTGTVQVLFGITEKVSEFSLKYIGAIRQTGFFILGFPDVTQGTKLTFHEWKSIGKDEKVTRACWKVLAGGTLLISGIFGLWSSLDYISRGYPTSLQSKLFTTSNIFFLLSSILRLKTSLDDYFAAADRPAEISAMMGVGANLYYIISACLMLYGAPTTFVIVLCCLGTATSFLQAIYNFSLTTN